jgi:hypothetical protein
MPRYFIARSIFRFDLKHTQNNSFILISLLFSLLTFLSSVQDVFEYHQNTGVCLNSAGVNVSPSLIFNQCRIVSAVGCALSVTHTMALLHTSLYSENPNNCTSAWRKRCTRGDSTLETVISVYYRFNCIASCNFKLYSCYLRKQKMSLILILSTDDALSHLRPLSFLHPLF